MAKQVTIFGLAVDTGRGREYAAVELVYKVDDSVSLEDIEYNLRKYQTRIAPVDPETGEKLPGGIVAVDTDNIRAGKTLNRIAFNKQLQKDLRNLEWTKDKRDR